MIETLFAILLELQRPKLSPEVADAIGLFYVSTDHELPDYLEPELKPALEKLWKRNQIWALPANQYLQSEIKWTRQHWPPANLPRIEELDRLPKPESVKDAVDTLNYMRDRLDQLEAFAAPWDEFQSQRAEIDNFLRLCYDISAAQRDGNMISQRQALQDVRTTVGDVVWFSDVWPPLVRCRSRSAGCSPDPVDPVSAWL